MIGVMLPMLCHIDGHIFSVIEMMESKSENVKNKVQKVKPCLSDQIPVHNADWFKCLFRKYYSNADWLKIHFLSQLSLQVWYHY